MCGLGGYSGVRPPNMEKLKIIGAYNIERGEDSCGIAINNNVMKGIGENKNFIKFCENNDIPEATENNVVILHTRKSTQGAHTVENAHPFEFYKKDNDTEPFFIGAHNGTINNETTLKKDYNLEDYKYNVDSQLLLKILSSVTLKNTRNLGVLNTYEGNAALLFFWPSKPNTLYVWKGATKRAVGGVYSEERPLFYWQETPESVYISSIRESLMFIGGDKDSVKSFDSNKIFEIKNGVIKDLGFTFDRYFPYTTNNSYTPTTVATPLPASTTVGNIDEYRKIFKGYLIYELKNFKKNPSATNTYLIDSEPNLPADEIAGGKIYYHKGRYYQNYRLVGLEGLCVLELDSLGYPSYSGYFDKNNVNKYYFYKGILLRDAVAALEFMNGIEEKRWYVDENGKITMSNNLKNIEVLRMCMGISFCTNDTAGHVKLCSNPGMFYTGDFKPVFSTVTYTFQNGSFVSAEKKPFVQPLITIKGNKETDSEDDQSILNQMSDKMIEENIEKEDQEKIQEILENLQSLKEAFEKSSNEKAKKMSGFLKQSFSYLDEHYNYVYNDEPLQDAEEILEEPETIYINNN